MHVVTITSPAGVLVINADHVVTGVVLGHEVCDLIGNVNGHNFPVGSHNTILGATVTHEGNNILIGPIDVHIISSESVRISA